LFELIEEIIKVVSRKRRRWTLFIFKF